MKRTNCNCRSCHGSRAYTHHSCDFIVFSFIGYYIRLNTTPWEWKLHVHTSSRCDKRWKQHVSMFWLIFFWIGRLWLSLSHTASACDFTRTIFTVPLYLAGISFYIQNHSGVVLWSVIDMRMIVWLSVGCVCVYVCIYNVWNMFPCSLLFFLSRRGSEIISLYFIDIIYMRIYIYEHDTMCCV